MKSNTQEIHAQNNSGKRDVNLDIMKGIGIIAVIVGHLYYPCAQFIYSFHMPLFFIIAGFLYRKTQLSESLRKGFNRLIVPYLITGISIYFIDFLASLYFNNSSLKFE